MNIQASSIRVDGGEESKGAFAFMDVGTEIGGLVLCSYVYPRWHYVVLAEKQGRIAVLSMPSKKWEQDLVDDGWVIKQVVSHEESRDA